MKIKTLASEVIDQIAAGEVVERPAHMVKELIENSIDAGATHLQIEFDFGGRYVKIVDDGCGMSREDLAKCLERFATSKISQTSDLWSLKTFGFRGEALASISAVSRLTIITRTNEASSALKLQSQFGQRCEIEESGGVQGTTLIVEDLFANTPVRLKFLKSESAEHVQIKTVIKALALANPEVEFRVTSKSKMVFLWTKVKTRLQRAQQIFDVVDLYEGQGERNACKVYSVFTDPHKTTQSSRSLWIFVQNRWVQDKSLQAAIMESYRNLLMHGEYPSVATWVECPTDEIDVNIHPTKSQVKFQDSSSAFKAVYHSLKDQLEKAPWISQLAQVHKTTANKNLTESVANLEFRQPEFSTTHFQKKDSVLSTLRNYAPTLNINPLPEYGPGKSLDISSAIFSADSSTPSAVTLGENINQWRWGDLQIIGQAQLTYIIAQNSKSLFFVDQHAAHERIVFERLMESWNEGRLECQEHLFPMNIDLSEDKIDVLMDKALELEKIKIYIERMGPMTVGIKASPSLIETSVYPKLIEKLAIEILDKGESFAIDKHVTEIFSSMACHSVVRAGQALSQDQMKKILIEMDESPLSGFCPHGRPVYIEYSLSKLERDFGRIV